MAGLRNLAPDLLSMIEEIRAIDNHSHAMPARRPAPDEGDRPDPLGSTPFPYPVRLRVTNPEHIQAWQALYGYPYQDMAEPHAREALRAKIRLMEQDGDHYPSWVLDQVGIDRILVCTSAMGPGQVAPRFLWVPYADALLVPSRHRAGNDQPTDQQNANELSADLDEYVDGVIRPQLEQWRDAGAVAIKFVIAYSRSLDVADVPKAVASTIYQQDIRKGELSAADRKALQDYLFRVTVREAGLMRLVVHIHTGVGSNPYYDIAGSNPLLLESVFNDETLRQTKFVMLHGGWPFEHQAGAMLMKPNVYADFSAQVFLRSARAMSQVLEEWLSWYPEKVLFGTDACPDNTLLANWEERLWLATRTARQALTLALARMVEAHEIDHPRAEKLARMVFRENATTLYGLER